MLRTIAFITAGYLTLSLTFGQATQPATLPADFDKPSLITLHYKSASLKEVYADLFKQAGAELVTSPPEDFFEREATKPVGVDLDNVPFWKAIDYLSARTGVGMAPVGFEGLRLCKGSAGPEPGARLVSMVGSAKVVAEQRSGPGVFESLDFMIEPRFQVVTHAEHVDLAEVTDVRGRVISRPGRTGRTYLPLPGNAFRIDFDPPINGAGLKGSIQITVVKRRENLIISDITKVKSVEKKLEGRSFALDVTRPEANAWSMRVTAYNTNPPAPAFGLTTITVLDANGRAMLPHPIEYSRAEDMYARLEFSFYIQQWPGFGPPEKLILNIPLDTQDINVPFEISFPRK
jgi:hypothetical protein